MKTPALDALLLTHEGFDDVVSREQLRDAYESDLTRATHVLGPALEGYKTSETLASLLVEIASADYSLRFAAPEGLGVHQQRIAKALNEIAKLAGLKPVSHETNSH